MGPQTTQRARTIAFMNQKGGVGKTTTTVNLGAAIAETGARVLIVDLDPQAHATLHLGLDPTQLDGTIYDLLLDPSHAPTEAIHKIGGNLDLIPSETDLAGAETELSGAHDRSLRLRSALAALDTAHDVIMIDCPPSLGVLTLNGLAAAREVIIPMQAHFLALQGVGKLLETVGLVAQSVNPELTVTGIVLCMHDSQTTHSREVVADLNAFFEMAAQSQTPWRDARLLDPPIRRNIKLAECPSFGQTVFDYAPTCPGAQDYRELARSLIGPRPERAAFTTDDHAAQDGGAPPPKIEIIISPDPGVESSP